MPRPPWRDEQSDGCSVPRLLRIFAPMESPEDRLVCVEHDRAYYAGGTRRDRAIADAMMLLGHLANGVMDVDEAHRRHVAVRIGGKQYWGENGRYTDEPEPAASAPVSVEAP